jgi:hypothetical protein
MSAPSSAIMFWTNWRGGLPHDLQRFCFSCGAHRRRVGKVIALLASGCVRILRAQPIATHSMLARW